MYYINIKLGGKSMIKRTISAFILFLLLFPTLISCGNVSEPVDGNQITTVYESDDIIDETERENIKDGIPTLNFNGKSFRVLYHGDEKFIRDIVAESENGEIVNDAVYERNLITEERLNVKIVPVEVGSGSFDVINAARTATLAMDDSYDLIVGHAIRTAVGVTEGLFIDWNTIPYIDTSRPWWNNSAVEQLTVGGKSYLLCGDYSTVTLGATYCMYFNKTLGENYGYPADKMYSTVLDGNWTVDTMKSVIKDLTVDLNGDGQMDENDLYGLSTTTESPAVAYQWAFDAPMTRKGTDGYPVMANDYDKWSSIVDTLYNLYYETDGTYVYTTATNSDMLFRQNQAFLFNNNFIISFSFRDLEIDYGIIPYPKFNAAQEEYKSMADGYHSLFAVSKAATDLELIGAVTELLNAESYRRVVPAYYEIALKVKYARDVESVQIMDIILAGCTFDFGYFYDNWIGFAFMLQDFMREKSKDFSSYYAKRENAAIEQFNTVISAFETIDN